ncbi:CAP domain-containing protein [Bacillus massilinigeriensis]|uniref:CAP domain-containing protein n=1 Tax=Bacillus mediterraneensis TaxID=1805474 RepID=UPI000A8916A4|nr:CAP domain-containing protein [Bacillus mediterraneensis]
MFKKTAGTMLLAGVLLGTSACGMNNNAADERDNRLNILGRENPGDGKDEGIDHNGPLTRDYNDNGDNKNRDDNLFDDRKKKNDMDLNDSISSYHTSKGSDSYPQTKAVLIQEAKYQFVPCQPGENTGTAGQAPPPEDFTRGTSPTPNLGNQNAPVPPKSDAGKNAQPGNNSQFVRQVIDLTNEQRSKSGLPPLKEEQALSKVAQLKSVDMQQKGYFSHTSPTYGSPFDMMRDQGISYTTAGENIAQGQQSPQEVVNAWMNSEGHRQNIMNRNFTHIGVGYESSGNHWTQMFIGK